MDLNLKSFLSRLPKLPSAFPSSPDLELPPTPSRPAGASYELEEFVVDRMPDLHLRPALLAAVSDVAQARSVLRDLGDRPDHETLDAARARLAEIENDILPDDDSEGRESRAEAEKEKAALCSIVSLYEMHEAYEGLLREAEERLEKMYRGSTDAVADGTAQPSPPLQQEEELEREQADEEVIGILQEGLTGEVERVNLSGRQLRHLPEAFGKMRCLLSLNLANNLLEDLPDAICGLEYLEELRVSSNNLVSLPDSIGLLSNLKILDVSSNKLKSLPDSIAKCRSLVELDASYNDLTYLPTSIGYELLNLEKLFIHLNKICSLPSSICEMRSLRILDAHFNQLQGLPPAFGKLINLEVLNLSSNFNDMQELPDSFGDLINPKELDLSNNQIHALPDRFGLLDKLCKLNLEQNPLQIPPMEVVSQGVEAVKEYMVKRRLHILLEESNSTSGEAPPARTDWLSRSTSWLNNWVAGVSESVNEVANPRSKTFKDPFLDRMM